jgi:hypothetical protein
MQIPISYLTCPGVAHSFCGRTISFLRVLWQSQYRLYGDQAFAYIVTNVPVLPNNPEQDKE